MNRRELFGSMVASAVGAVAAVANRSESANSSVASHVGFVTTGFVEVEIDAVQWPAEYIGETPLIDMDDPAMVERIANATVVWV